MKEAREERTPSCAEFQWRCARMGRRESLVDQSGAKAAIRETTGIRKLPPIENAFGDRTDFVRKRAITAIVCTGL